MVLPNKRNIVYRCVNKHPSLKTKFFDDDYLPPLLSKLKINLVMGDFNINLLNNDISPEVSEFFDNLPLHFFPPYILQHTRLAK